MEEEKAKEEKPKKSALTKATLTLIDIKTGKTEQREVDLARAASRFNFNSKDLFNPDANSTEVAEQCWNWLLNPLSYKDFKETIAD